MQRTRLFPTLVVALGALTLMPAVVAGATTSGATTAGPADAAASEIVTPAAAGRTVTIFSGTSTSGATTYWDVGHKGPNNLVSPVNYVGGNATLRLNVLSKPSTKALLVQVCMWRNNYQQETCSPAGTITRTGTYNFNLGRPAGWWKKGTFSWATPYQYSRLMVKDPASKRLMMSRNCGAACYRGNDLGQHVPIRMSGTLTFSA